jgi:O-antigen ligase
VLRIAEVGLTLALCVAVLAFGGTAPPFFAVTQIVVLLLGILLLLATPRSRLASVHAPILAPTLLIILVLLQILPLRAFLQFLLGAAHSGLPMRPNFTISIAPYETVSQLLLLVTYLTAFYLVVLLCQERDAKKRIVFALVAVGMFEALYGLLQYLTGWQQIFGYVKKYYLEDATGTYINRNHFAGLLEMILPFAVVLALRQARVLRHVMLSEAASIRRVLSGLELLPLVFWLFLATTLFAALIFSRSRMGIISALVSLVVVLVLARTSSFPAISKTLVAILFFLGVVGLVVWIGSDPVIFRFESLGQEYVQSDQNRISIWRDTLHLIHQHPLFGTGLGTFSLAYPSVQTAFLTLFVDHAHCDYLEVFSELGLPGGFLLFGSIFWILARTISYHNEARERFDKDVLLACAGSLVAILLHSMVDFNLHIPGNALMFSVILAVACSSARQLKIPETSPSSTLT